MAITNRAIAGWSFFLAVPAQYLGLLALLLIELATVGISHGGGGGSFGCWNFHQAGLWSCSFGEMLMSVLMALVLVNLVTVGGVSVVAVALLALLLLGARSIAAAARRPS